MSSGHDGDQQGQFRYRFGTAQFDEARFELEVDGVVVEVQRRPLEILAYLLRHAGEVVTREELLREVWQGRPTVDHVVANALAKLRAALGANASFVVTQSRIGYRLQGSVERMTVGRIASASSGLRPGDPVPARDTWLLDRLLNATTGSEVWLARDNIDPRARRVFKFALNAERLNALKREVTLYRVLTTTLGQRPDIVSIDDRNFETSPFFIACEYGGQNLTEWAATEDRLAQMTREDRIRLFLQIADAVDAAHGVGVLHKDIKPANILIAPGPTNAWQVRLTDFGSGWLLAPEQLVEMGITRLGMTVNVAKDSSGSATGTLPYLAPELLNYQAPTIRSDVYALGLVLYQLVTGDLRRPMASGWRRHIDDALLAEDIADATDGDPAHRIGSVDELTRKLRNLPQRRQHRVNQLAAEQAARNAHEKLRATRARRPWIIAAGVLLLTGAVISTSFYFQARRSQLALERQVDVTHRLNEFLSEDLIAAANPAVSGRPDIPFAEAARRAASRIPERFAQATPQVRGAIFAAMQTMFSDLAEYEDAVAAGIEAVAAYEDAGPDVAVGLVSARLRLAEDLVLLSRFDEATAEVERSESELAQLGRPASAQQAWLYYTRSRIAANRLEISEALTLLDDAWRTHESMPVDAGLADKIRQARGVLRTMSGDYDRAERELRALLADQTERLGGQSPAVARSQIALGVNLGYQRRFAEALELMSPAAMRIEQTYGDTHFLTLDASNRIAAVYFQSGDYVQSARLWGRVYQCLLMHPSRKNDTLVAIQSNRGLALKYGGKAGDAELVFLDALGIARSYLADGAPRVQHMRYELADALLEQNKPETVAQLLDGLDADAINLSRQAPDWEGRIAWQRGRLALLHGDVTRAKSELQRAFDVISAKNPDGSIEPRRIQQLIARSSDREGQSR